MICYRDKTFCINPNCPGTHNDKLTHEIERAAVKWWGSEDAPIAVANLCGDEVPCGGALVHDGKLDQL